MGLLRRRPFSADDPRRLRELLDRCVALAAEHAVPSVVVGLAGDESDPLFPELVDFLASALRMEDTVFRLTRERAVLFLADVDRGQVESILERLRADFRERFPDVRSPRVELGYYEIAPGAQLALKEVLPAVFGHVPAVC
jgi:hypothetical protein